MGFFGIQSVKYQQYQLTKQKQISCKSQSSVLSSNQTIFENICSLLTEAPFSGVFQQALCVHRTDNNFPGRYIYSSNRYHFLQEGMSVEQIPIFQGQFFLPPNIYRFSRKSFLSGIEPNKAISRKVLHSNRYFSNWSRWLLSVWSHIFSDYNEICESHSCVVVVLFSLK